ncbi:flavin reductase family protein [Actinomadura litoris]|uniref:flavin reductase family protein n=1 Tax=Actinomadura litoris TaxID=2678616 RepID=UPI001FA7B3C5|nr:flavin reductase family protein [Actinomadura litoris]
MSNLTTRTSAPADEFREVMSHVASGLVVIAGLRGGRPAGLTASSFFSVSMRPRLVGFCVATASRTWPGLAGDGGALCVSLLARDQRPVADAMASRDPDKHTRVEWTLSPAGRPVAAGAIAAIDCEVAATVPAGDHLIVTALVGAITHYGEREPLLYHRRGYHGLGPRLP